MRFAPILALALFAVPQDSRAEAPPLPFAVGGAFELIDHTGAVRTEQHPQGHAQLVFFGYANCQEICSAALPLMGQIVDEVAQAGGKVQPVMITVDPKRDTVDSLGPDLALHHPDFLGLTGTEAALQVAYDAFQIEVEELFVDLEYGPVFSHGSFFYLLDGAGQTLTLIPPILDPDRAAEIVKGYVLETAS